jgi:hypothetical protein
VRSLVRYYNTIKENEFSDKRLNLSQILPSVMQRILGSCDNEKNFQHLDSSPTPSRDAVARIIHTARHILFPGYFTQTVLSSSNLGGETVIGARSTIGGNAWITESVPPDTKVYLKKPELIYAGNDHKRNAKASKKIFARLFADQSTGAECGTIATGKLKF